MSKDFMFNMMSGRRHFNAVNMVGSPSRQVDPRNIPQAIHIDGQRRIKLGAAKQVLLKPMIHQLHAIQNYEPSVQHRPNYCMPLLAGAGTYTFVKSAVMIVEDGSSVARKLLRRSSLSYR